VDSYGLLAVAMSRSSAAETLRIAAGDELALVPLDDEARQGGEGSASNGGRVQRDSVGRQTDAARGGGRGRAGASSPVSPVRLRPRRPAGP
jgi:hypothetical protein